jgi:hypothetical protein
VDCDNVNTENGMQRGSILVTVATYRRCEGKAATLYKMVKLYNKLNNALLDFTPSASPNFSLS